MRQIISLSGKAQAGKDETARILSERYGFTQLSFARNLKLLTQCVFDIPARLTDTQDGKSTSFKTPIKFTKKHLEDIVLWMKDTHALDSDLAKAKIKELKKQYVNKLEFTTPREILQIIGTEIIRSICNTYHVDIVLETIIRNPENNFVISDSRYFNERDALRRQGATLVYIDRPFLPATETSNHISENSFGTLSEYEYIVDNDGTIADLEVKVDKLMKEINGKKE